MEEDVNTITTIFFIRNDLFTWALTRSLDLPDTGPIQYESLWVARAREKSLQTCERDLMIRV